MVESFWTISLISFVVPSPVPVLVIPTILVIPTEGRNLGMLVIPT